MKAALNGCLNLSVLDGWWDEWFQPDFGWAIPTADGTATDDDRRDDLEAAALYELLEQRVAPRFYERGQHGLPDRSIEMVRQTLTHLGPKVLAGRMVRGLVERLYAPRPAPTAPWPRRRPANWPPGSPASGRPGPGSRWTIWRPPPPPRPPNWAPPSPCACGWRWPTSPRTTSRSRRSRAASARRTASRTRAASR